MRVSTHAKSISLTNIAKIRSIITLVLATGAIVIGVAQPAAASSYSAQIQNLQSQNSSNDAARSGLQNSAASLQSQIDALQTTITTINDQIATNQERQAQINQQIADTQSQIDQEQTVLAGSVRDLYISSDMSMIEIMASSKNLSDYVDKQQYTISAQSSVKKHLDKINALKADQQKDKSRVDGLLADNKSMQSQLATQKAQVDTLLAMNETQQAAYTASIASNNSQITALEAKQAAENASFLKSARRSPSSSASQVAAPAGIGAVDGNNYPYADAPWPNDIPDPWGMDERQCVSYAAWAVTASGRTMPYWGGKGNAKQWPDDAASAGIPADSSPRAGDVAIKTSGTYGHAMYVNSVNSDGTINISQYNADWNGTYSTATIDPSGLVFIHFP